ncbi:MAG TPA: hypothetical protein VI792_10285, partial [Candidatus Eisenbacteria bacterium]
ADTGLASSSGLLLLPARVSVRPDRAALGEPMRYAAWVLVPRGTRAQWLPPDSGGAFTWGALAARRTAGPAGYDTLALETRLQVFATGPVSIPGPSFVLPGARDPAPRRLPVAHVTLLAMPGVADSNAELRPVRGPLPAPWWERVPWTLVLAAAALIAAVILLIVWVRRRAKTAAPARAGPAVARDPAEVLLADLAALRAQELPRQGRFADHALILTRILRRFLEATAGTPHPGDTTPELLRHLEAAGFEAGLLAQLALLLRLWDQVKFARQPSTAAEAARAEQVIEEMAQRRLRERAAAQAAGAAPPAAGERVA